MLRVLRTQRASRIPAVDIKENIVQAKINGERKSRRKFFLFLSTLAHPPLPSSLVGNSLQDRQRLVCRGWTRMIDMIRNY